MSEIPEVEVAATVQMMRSQNAQNIWQGSWPRVLCVCSAGLLRSPTLTWVLSNAPYNCNARAAGSAKEFALIPVDQVLLDWAHSVVFANRENHEDVLSLSLKLPDSVYVLDIPDQFEYRAPKLIKEIRRQLKNAGFPYYQTRAERGLK